MSETDPTGHNPANGQLPEGWVFSPLKPHIQSRSGDSKIIKGKQQSKPADGLIQGFSASGPDVWVESAQYQTAGVVVSAVGARCGKTFLAQSPWTAIANTHALIPDEDIDVRFLWHLSNREEWWIKSGTAQPFVKVKDTLERSMPIPPLAEQKKIVEILEEQLSRLDAALESVRVVREKAAQFRRSLLHAAFTGTLTGHNPADGQLPEGWQQIALGEIVSMKSGFAYKSRDWQETGVPVIKIANVRAGKVTIEGCSHIDESIAAETVEFAVNESDILMTLTGEIGAIGVYRESFESRLNQRVARIDLDATERILLSYLIGFLESPEFRSEMWRLSKGMAQPNISPKQVVAIGMGLPPLTEQEQIVEILEEQLSRLDAALAVADAIEKRSAALRRSLLHAAFTGRLTEQWRELSHV